MTTAELLAVARRVLDDSATPYLWSDVELTSYLQDAEMEAAVRADLLEADGEATYCTIPIVAGTSAYSLNALVYEVQKARVAGEGQYLSRTSREKLDKESAAWEDETGTPFEYYVVGNTIRLRPNPTSNGTLNMVVLRLPVSPIGASPEIHAKYHFRMLDWVYKRAYEKRDPDTFDKEKALDYEARFKLSFGPRWDAKMQTRHLRKTSDEMDDTYYA